MLLTELKGIGEKTAALINKLGILSVEELLRYYPVNYEIYEKPLTINEFDNRILVSVEGMVMKNLEVKQVRNLQIISTVIKDKENSLLKVTWFNMPFLRNTVKYGMHFIFRGRINNKNSLPVLEQPEIFTLGKYEELIDKMQPVYRLTKGLSNKTLIKAQKEALKVNSEIISDYLKAEDIGLYDIMQLNNAISIIHFPANKEEFILARKRLVFDEFFYFIYNLRKLKEKEIFVSNNHKIENFYVSEQVLSKLPYTLTDAQYRVLKEIRTDLSSDKIMQRLIQGDVGSGKTIIAFLTMFDIAAKNGQSVLMAPTEVLAEQHYDNVLKMINEYNLNINAVLLTGSTTSAMKKIIYKDIADGTAQLIIGTHAVFQDKVRYKELQLVITDEQHRFGVLQRSALKDKGDNPHVIVMSATPIPRTLAIILYGDLDISIIDELPASRLPIKNCVVTKDFRKKAYNFIEKEINNGRQAYIICPMVEENDTLEAENVIDYSEILRKNLSPDINVEYLHGKMKASEKNNIMRRFADNKINVLVSTTVIEVGINVPNATVMMVENAERFGLASLHQLRGRVGRGNYQSYCIFVSSSTNEDKLKRLDILNKSNDGFKIASEDLKLRGPGDFFGIRQSGEMEFKLADVYTDGNIMKSASLAVQKYLHDGNELVDKRLNNDIVIY